MRLKMKSEKTGKPWGYESLIIKTDKYVAKMITIYNGKRTSLQFHNVKDESVMVLSGNLQVTLGDAIFLLGIGSQSMDIQHGRNHRFTSVGNTDTVMLEVSTPELDDVVRIEDDFGRVVP